jgi:hypothetical protein
MSFHFMPVLFVSYEDFDLGANSTSEKMQSSSPYTDIDNAHQIDPRAEITHSSTTASGRVLESRVNIMPAVDRLLPVLDAFGNIGHSGHKEGGKAPVPA